MASSFSRLVRFIPKSNPSLVRIGQPIDAAIDVGLALYQGKDVAVNTFSGSSILSPGEKQDTVETIGTILSPLAQNEVGTIRCLGLNYKSHAAEMKMDIPNLPTLFLKPATALANPWPAPTVLPKITQKDNTGDYESEMAIIIGRDAKDVPVENALDYVLGYTAANDISSRTSQMNQSQWCFSKGFDTSCPIGPAVVSSSVMKDASDFHIRGIKNGKVMQDCSLKDMVFGVAELVSFLSQGTTLSAGTVILTGTPPGVGVAKNPKEFLKAGDEFHVELLPHVGTLITAIQNE